MTVGLSDCPTARLSDKDTQMAKRTLAEVTKREQGKRSAVDHGDELIGKMESQGGAKPAGRNTARVSISLLPEERRSLEKRVGHLWEMGHAHIRVSRLVRIALKMLEGASDDEVVRLAEEVPNLERRPG